MTPEAKVKKKVVDVLKKGGAYYFYKFGIKLFSNIFFCYASLWSLTLAFHGL